MYDDDYKDDYLDEPIEEEVPRREDPPRPTLATPQIAPRGTTTRGGGGSSSGGGAGSNEETEGYSAPDLETESEHDDGRRWYVVHCYSGYENKVRHAIEQRTETMGMEDKIFETIVPTEEQMEIKDGKRKVVERRVFPGYILVQMIMDEDAGYVVRNTPGVTGFGGM